VRSLAACHETECELVIQTVRGRLEQARRDSVNGLASARAGD
jgi:hypothetical protein